MIEIIVKSVAWIFLILSIITIVHPIMYDRTWDGNRDYDDAGNEL